MKIPSMCSKTISFDNEKAGWHVPNSIHVSDIHPIWRLGGGGVCSEDLIEYDKVDSAYDKAIVYTQDRIKTAEKHLEKLMAAKQLNLEK